MRGIQAKARLGTGLFLALALTVGLSACSDIDNMFGDDSDQVDLVAPTAGAPGAAAPAATPAPAPVAGSGAPVATITPVTITPGTDTGTAVNKTIQSLRGQLEGLEGKLSADSQQLAALRNTGAAAATAYQESKARITARLQIGTTKGNPELVSEWNNAQASLDSLSANINALNALGTDISNDSSTAHFVQDQIGATFNVSGAVDEDHRQLSLLQDETSQTQVLIDRLLTEVSGDVQRQTAYVASERGGLTTLASAIKNGELYGGLPGISAAAASGGFQLAGAGSPLVTIRFDRNTVDYQQMLYAALNQALASRPNAGFEVVAVAPTRGNAASVQIAQTAAERHARDVMRSITDMGVPAARLSIASATDPGATTSEVRVFVR